MTTDAEKALVLYRLENAHEKLAAAKDLLDNKHYKDSVSRSYYAIFTAARALLAIKKLDSANIPVLFLYSINTSLRMV